MTDLENEIFQALCEVENLSDQFETGAVILHCRDDVVTLRLTDGSEMSIHLAPIMSLVETLRAMR